MKIKKFVKLKGNKYKIFLDNDEEITLFDDVIVKYNLLIKRDISTDILKEVTSYNEKMQAYYEALKYIAKKLRTKKEIERYLEKKYDRIVIEECINKLINNKYLNNSLYIESYINDQINLSSNGPFKIRKNLENLGFKDEEIELYLNKLSPEIWIEKINKIVDKKVKINRNLGEYRLKEKIRYDLVNLGYDCKLIDEKLNNILVDDNVILNKEYQKMYQKLSKKYQGKELELHLISKLLSKGFSYDEIIKKVNLQD